MPARVVRVEGNKLWIQVKEEPAEEQAARGSRHSSRESRPATRHLSQAREEAPVDTPMEQDPHPRIFEMISQATGKAEVGPPTKPRLQVKQRAGIPIHRDWPIGFKSEPQIPKAEPPSPQATEQAMITFHHVEKVIANWQHRFDTITQGDKTVEEYFVEFMLLKNATKCTQYPNEVLLQFWKSLRTKFHVALGGSTYHTAARLADDAAKLEKMGRDRKPGIFMGLGDPVPTPPTAPAHMDQRNTRPADWLYFLDAYRTHADLRINPSPGEEAGKGSKGWLEESDDESDIWSEGEPEGKHYWDSPPSATTPARTQSD
ncbi:hypothetical protein AALP_AA7G136800 [Arabis alpina]|uniref:Retrotransposon gag domain-containing protein n=1 Tax=Arabis alpina TaxID=50452 RepID=A0A087GHV7_ARAAL|nr:hypothetical protein AALP_AA7G136800 [Arabis alpina]